MSNISIEITVNPKVVSNPRPQIYRVLHDPELPDGIRSCAPCPEVFRLLPFQSAVMNEKIQRLYRSKNPTMSDKEWTALNGNGLAFTNNSGFPGHHNYITGEEPNKPDAYFDQCRICGGAAVTGQEGYSVLQLIGDFASLVSGIVTRKVKSFMAARLSFTALASNNVLFLETIRPNNVPSIEDIKPWLIFDALIVGPKGGFSKFPQGDGERVFVPLVSSKQAYYPLAKLQRWNRPGLPDPYKIGG